eukprot:5779918-Amphidinium_carterae.1
MAQGWESRQDIAGRFSRRLAILGSVLLKLLHGTEVVPATNVGSWPGLRPRGEVSEYQLVLRAQ